MSRVGRWARWVLLGADDSWGARVATGRVGITGLAILTMLLHALDLATGLRMMLVYGINLEQNPLARFIMLHFGPLCLAEIKLGVVLGGVLVLVRTAQHGRPRLARNCLVVTAMLGMLGFTSNLVGYSVG